MNDTHSNSEQDNILSKDEIEKNLRNKKEHFEQIDWIIKSKGKLVVYLSIIYGYIVLTGLIYLYLVIL
jgi:hypothetical protein